MKPNVKKIEKPKDFKGTLKRLMKYLSAFKIHLAGVLFMALLSTVLVVIAPAILGKVTTTLYKGVSTGFFDWNKISVILIFLGITYIISQFFSFLQNFIMGWISSKTIYTLRKELDCKLNKLPLRYLDSKTHGEILSRVTNDIETINGTLQQSLTQVITAVFTIIGILVMMLSISVWMSLISLIVVPFSLLASSKVIKHSQKYFKGQQAAIGKMNGHVEEMYTGHNIVKAFHYEETAKEKFQQINGTIRANAWKAEFFSGTLMPLVTFFGNMGYIFIAILGCVFAVNGRIEIGQVQAFIQYVKQFNQPLAMVSNIASTVQSTVAAAERVFEILDESQEISDEQNHVKLSHIRGDVSIENVTFGYTKENPLIKNMNIEVKSGQMVAIVGPTGAGKTTLINLLMRFYDVDSGSIRIDGIDIKDMKRNDLRGLFGMVLQDTWLFRGTIEENLAYGKEGVSSEQIQEAAKMAYAHHFIKTFSEGYQTMINEEADNISQGQKQLLTIARAILADPEILILDEATSSVDTRTEVLIQKAMKKLIEGKTSFVIAHRLSTIRDADIILVMRNGNVVEQGSHEELLVQNGFYAQLYNSQFEE